MLINNRDSFGIWSSNQEGVVADGREQSSSVKGRDFLDLAIVNSKSNS